MATVAVGAGPLGVAVNQAGTRAYVGNGDGTVSVIRTDTNAQRQQHENRHGGARGDAANAHR